MYKDLQQIRDEYAAEQGFVDWYELFYDHGFEIGTSGHDEIATRYAEEQKRELVEMLALGTSYK